MFYTCARPYRVFTTETLPTRVHVFSSFGKQLNNDNDNDNIAMLMVNIVSAGVVENRLGNNVMLFFVHSYPQ